MVLMMHSRFRLDHPPHRLAHRNARHYLFLADENPSAAQAAGTILLLSSIQGSAIRRYRGILLCE
jgi:hypothetical protein